MTFSEARGLMPGASDAEQRIVRYAVAGGMARYLGELGAGALKTAVCRSVLDRRAPLFDDPRSVLEQELRSPAVYFSVLEALAEHPASSEHLTQTLGLKSNVMSFYLDTRRDMRLVTTTTPVGARDGSRSSRHRISDGFIRFWFRYVFGNQDALQEGLSAADLWRAEVAPTLSDFVACAYEELCVRYVRVTAGARAPNAGGWWGPSLSQLRRTKQRMVEEIDVVGARKRQLVIAGECKWTNQPMPLSVLKDLREFKLPAVAQEGRLRTPAAGPRILLFARSGFSDDLQAAARTDPDVELVDLDTLVAGLDGDRSPEAP